MIKIPTKAYIDNLYNENKPFQVISLIYIRTSSVKFVTERLPKMNLNTLVT